MSPKAFYFYSFTFIFVIVKTILTFPLLFQLLNFKYSMSTWYVLHLTYHASDVTGFGSEGIAQFPECLCSMHEVLSLVPRTILDFLWCGKLVIQPFRKSGELKIQSHPWVCITFEAWNTWDSPTISKKNILKYEDSGVSHFHQNNNNSLLCL